MILCSTTNVNMKNIILPIVLLACLIWSPAQADYMPPTIEESYQFLVEPGQWELNSGKLKLKSLGKELPFDSFLFWHFTRSDIICTGGDLEKLMREEIAKVAKSQSPTPVFVKLARAQGAKDLSVVQFQSYDAKKAFGHASEYGSFWLALKAPQVRGLGAKGYAKKIQVRSQKDWSKLVGR